MVTFLLIAALIILLCLVCNRFSDRFGVPSLLLFIGLGLLFGADGPIRIHFDNYVLSESICSAALIFIMFYGGFGTRWKTAKPAAGKAILLSTAGVLLTAAFTGLFCRFALGFDWLESLLVGAVLSSTDAASVFSILRSKRLALREHTAPLLEIESGSNDPCAYMLTIIILTLMSGTADPLSFLKMVVLQFLVGILCGAAIAAAARFALTRLRDAMNGLETVFLVAVVLLSYAVPTALGGNGYLSAYLVGILLGNSRLRQKTALVHFFDGITSLMQISVFFLLGLLAFPSMMAGILRPALLIALFLTFIARPAAVALLLRPFGCSGRQIALVSWAGLRGAASIVFAIMATVSPAYLKNDLFHIVFCVVLLSIAVQGSLLPAVARRLHMIDPSADVLRTFNDYQEEQSIQFIRLQISENHPWLGLRLRELTLPPEMLVVSIQRGRKLFIPDGSAKLHLGDKLVITAPAFRDNQKIDLRELILPPDHEWCGRALRDIDLPRGTLIVLSKREGAAVIPRGDTVLQASDTVVLTEMDA